LYKQNIKNLSIKEISLIIEKLWEKRHRKTQLLKWLYQKRVDSFYDMTNIPLDLRKKFDELFSISALRPTKEMVSSKDNSTKFLLECEDKLLIETVLMKFEKHQTICISSQVGCSLGCRFCRTGKNGLERNLRSDEILNQVIFFKNKYIPPRKRYNIVFMGMGEPFLNSDNVFRAIEILNDLDAFALGEKRITVSTIGFPDKIIEAAKSDLKFGLAVSLNATTDRIRKEIMPASKNISDTLSAAQKFAELKGTRTTLEYVLLNGINDSDEDAKRLAKLTSGKPFKINLIPFNTWDGCKFSRPGEERMGRFIELLLPRAPAVTVRRSRGEDIGAACGQLSYQKGKTTDKL
jgi:23S rRNA (adenine2503-C2)-methyltransferase